MKHVQPMGLPAGIYFHLSNEAYHGDPALSHSGMTQILVSWQDYWVRSCHNPDRAEYKPTDAMKFGDRSGHLLLDPEDFHEKYSTYGRAGNKHGGIYLSSVEYKKLTDSIDCVLDVPIGKEHFSNGYPEVSIFWPDPATGIMLRCKIDFLRTFGAIDFKRIASVDNYGIGRAVKSQGLDIQNFLYIEGIKAARRMLLAMPAKEFNGFADQERVDVAWLIAFMNDEDLLFRFLFQRSAPPWIWEFRELEDEVLREGANAVNHALKRFKQGIENYGIGAPPMGSSVVKTISQYHVPRRDYDYD